MTDLKLVSTAIKSQTHERFERFDLTTIKALISSDELLPEEQKQLKRYLRTSKKGVRKVSYKPTYHGFGRIYADKGLSLQSFSQRIRHTLACNIYDDVDIVNAHPVLLSHLCDAWNISCKELREYINNREKYLSEVVTSCDVTRSSAKKLFLRVMYGGAVSNWEQEEKAEGDVPTFVYRFKEDLTSIMDALYNKYPSVTNIIKKSRRKEYSNKKASVMSIIVQMYENIILDHIVTFFTAKGRNVDVLVFDGCMIQKQNGISLPSSLLTECEKYIKEQCGFSVNLVIKSMDDKYDLDNDQDEKREPVEFRINRKDEFCWYDFYLKYNGNHYASKSDAIDAVSDDVGRVLAYVADGKGYYVKKDDLDDKLHFILECCNFTDLSFHIENDRGGTDKVTFYELISTYPILPVFSVLGCNPDPSRLPRNAFNLWKGFKAQIVPELDMRYVQPLLDFLLEVWSDNDQTVYRYLLSWLHCLLITPQKKTGQSIFAYSLQGCGKNTFTDFLRDYVMGNGVFTETVGIESLTEKHSESLEGRRLVVVDECSSTRKEFLNNFNKMKQFITGDKITINPKGIRPYTVDNFCNLVIFTNHLDSLYLESSDRRYLCIQLSNVHRQDFAYFKALRKQCFNDVAGCHFLTYLSQLQPSNLVSLNDVPETSLRQDIKEISKPSIERFIDYLKEEMEQKNILPEKVPGSEFYKWYKTMCYEKEIRPISMTKFGVKVKQFITKSRGMNGVVYDLATLA